MKSSAAPNYISLTPSNSNISDSVEVLDIPNMRPEQPKRKKTPKKLRPLLRPTSGGSPGSGNNPKVKKNPSNELLLYIQKDKECFFISIFLRETKLQKKSNGWSSKFQFNKMKIFPSNRREYR